MSSRSIRRLVAGDERLAEAACRLFGLEGNLDAGPFLQRTETLLLVAEVGEEIAGWVYGHELMHPDGELTMLLYELDVVEAQRGRGHGSALVSAFVMEALERGCTEVWVLTDRDNDAALATYRSARGTPDGGGQVMFTWKLREGRHS